MKTTKPPTFFLTSKKEYAHLENIDFFKEKTSLNFITQLTVYLTYVCLCTYVCGHMDVNSTSFLLPCDWTFHSTCCEILPVSLHLLLHHELWGLPSVYLLYRTRHVCFISYVRSFR